MDTNLSTSIMSQKKRFSSPLFSRRSHNQSQIAVLKVTMDQFLLMDRLALERLSQFRDLINLSMEKKLFSEVSVSEKVFQEKNTRITKEA